MKNRHHLLLFPSLAPLARSSLSRFEEFRCGRLFTSRWLRSRRFERFRCNFCLFRWRDSLVGWISDAEVISHGLANSSRSLAIYIRIESVFFLIFVLLQAICDYLALLIQFFSMIRKFWTSCFVGFLKRFCSLLLFLLRVLRYRISFSLFFFCLLLVFCA